MKYALIPPLCILLVISFFAGLKYVVMHFEFWQFVLLEVALAATTGLIIDIREPQ